MEINGINTYNESPLHAALKAYIALPGDVFETTVDGYIIDVKRGDLLIEVQTSLFSAIKTKLLALTKQHPVRLVYPVTMLRWIVKPSDVEDDASPVTRRKSPKTGSSYSIFSELVSFPKLVAHENFSIEVLYIYEEEVRKWVGKRAWRRRGWAIDHRELIEVVGRAEYHSPSDFAALLPQDLPETFTTTDLSTACACRIRLARQMAYCLHKMQVINQVGKQGNSNLYHVADAFRMESISSS